MKVAVSVQQILWITKEVNNPPLVKAGACKSPY